MQKYTKYFIYKKILHTLHQKNKPSAPIVRKKLHSERRWSFIKREMYIHQEEIYKTSATTIKYFFYKKILDCLNYSLTKLSFLHIVYTAKQQQHYNNNHINIIAYDIYIVPIALCDRCIGTFFV